MHISNILKDGELTIDSVIKDYLTTASDGKPSYSLSPAGGGRGWKKK